MIYDLESKSARELREVVKIQMKEYLLLQTENKDLINRIARLNKKVAELERKLSESERVIRVPANENTACDYDLKP